MELALYITAFTTLFVVIDPIGLLPSFLALTQGMTAQQRRAVALRACICAIGVLTVFGLLGENALHFMGISMPAFQIAGGLLLFLTALEMLFELRSKRRGEKGKTAQDDDEIQDPSIFPIAIPLVSGPGAIAAMILLMDQAGGDFMGGMAYIGVMLSVICIVFILFSTAHIIERGLGKTGTIVMTRLFGMLLAALAVQFVLDGLAGFGLLASQ